MNLLRIPYSAVGKVYYTERTPQHVVEEIDERLNSRNNRYGVQQATKVVLAEDAYRYDEAGAGQVGKAGV